MTTESDPFEPDPTINKILGTAEDVGTPRALQAADEMINGLGETPKEK